MISESCIGIYSFSVWFVKIEDIFPPPSRLTYFCSIIHVKWHGRVYLLLWSYKGSHDFLIWLFIFTVGESQYTQRPCKVIGLRVCLFLFIFQCSERELQSVCQNFQFLGQFVFLSELFSQKNEVPCGVVQRDVTEIQASPRQIIQIHHTVMQRNKAPSFYSPAWQYQCGLLSRSIRRPAPNVLKLLGLKEKKWRIIQRIIIRSSRYFKIYQKAVNLKYFLPNCTFNAISLHWKIM